LIITKFQILDVLEKILRVPNSDPVEIDPKNYQDHEVLL